MEIKSKFSTTSNYLYEIFDGVDEKNQPKKIAQWSCSLTGNEEKQTMKVICERAINDLDSDLISEFNYSKNAVWLRFKAETHEHKIAMKQILTTFLKDIQK